MNILEQVKTFRRKFPADTVSVSASSSFPTAPNASTLKGQPPLEGMKNWLLTLGHTTATINKLNVIHVAGTKGKGSTCAYIDSFLREHARRSGISRKIGLYTSPSLWPQNRIRIDGKPLPDSVFSQQLLEVIQGLSLDANPDLPVLNTTRRPGFLQMMAILSFHTFIREGTDVVICEAHHGGQYDATNFVERPVITAITRIGKDHVDNLGGSIKNIAWHKSGIFKNGVPAFTVPQDSDAEQEIKRRAGESNVTLGVINVKDTLLQFIDCATFEAILPELRENIALAAQITQAFLQRSGHSLDRSDVEIGIKMCRWPGRFDIVNSYGSTWYLDGAHNEISMEVVANWFERVANNNSTRILIFAHFSPDRTRDWSEIINTLGSLLHPPIEHAIFVQEIEFDTHFRTTEQRLQEYKSLWQDNWPCSVHTVRNVAMAIDKAKSIANLNGAQILVTGSLYLVEAALHILDK